MADELKITVADGEAVTSLIYRADKKLRIGISLLLGHGAGSGQTSGFMVSFAEELAARGLDAVTFNFQYTEKGRGAPDSNDKLEACYRSAIDAIRKHRPLAGNQLAIGGKSMGGRIASQVAAAGDDALAGLVFLGYPLHPPGKPDQLRSRHLPEIKAPMLFVQGSRDAFGTPGELRPILKKLDAKIYEIEGGDHSFKVPKSAGVPQKEVYSRIQDEIAAWLKAQV
jgi:predicted alpha/beta-hydrolase family hydrolase